MLLKENKCLKYIWIDLSFVKIIILNINNYYEMNLVRK